MEPDGSSAPRRGEEEPEADTARKSAMNKRDYHALEREYITTRISIRELCRRHGIGAHSAVVTQARKGDWEKKREAYQSRASDSFITHHADRMAAREAELHDEALEAIAEAIAKFRADMRATEMKLVNGEWVELPVMRLMPKDIAILIDRLMVLSDRPSTISEIVAPASEAIPVDVLQRFVELTRGMVEPASQASPIPRSPRRPEG